MTSVLLMPPGITPSMIEAFRESFPNIPEEDLQPLSEFIEDYKSKVARPLLTAKDLQTEYTMLRPSAIELHQQAAQQLETLIESHPEVVEIMVSALKRLGDAFSLDELSLLGPEADTFQGALKAFSLQSNDLMALVALGAIVREDYEDSLEELVTEVLESEVDTRMCLLPVFLLLTHDIDVPIEAALDNARTLTQWANSFALKYIRDAGQLIQSVLSLPENSSVRYTYYSRKIEEFIGSGPKGIYQALLEERKLDAQRE